MVNLLKKETWREYNFSFAFEPYPYPQDESITTILTYGMKLVIPALGSVDFVGSRLLGSRG